MEIHDAAKNTLARPHLLLDDTIPQHDLVQLAIGGQILGTDKNEDLHFLHMQIRYDIEHQTRCGLLPKLGMAVHVLVQWHRGCMAVIPVNVHGSECERGQ